MFILTEDLEIVPESIYDSALYGTVISSHNKFEEAQEAQQNEIERLRIKTFYNQNFDL